MNGKWKYHKGFKNRPAHYFPEQKHVDGWEKAQCGYFAYPDMLEEADLIDLRVCCLKCFRSATVPHGVRC